MLLQFSGGGLRISPEKAIAISEGNIQMSGLQKTGITYWIYIVVFFILTFGIGVLSFFAQITEYGKENWIWS